MSALESDAHQLEGLRRAKTSENIAVGFAGEGPKVSLTAPWPPPCWTGPAKRYVQSVFELLERVRPAKPREIQHFVRQAAASHPGEQPGEKIIGIISRKNKFNHFDVGRRPGSLFPEKAPAGKSFKLSSGKIISIYGHWLTRRSLSNPRPLFTLAIGCRMRVLAQS